MSLWTPYASEQALDLSKTAGAASTKNEIIIYSPVQKTPPAITSSAECHLSPSLYNHRYHPCYRQQTPSPPQLVPSGHHEMPLRATSPASDTERGRKPPRPFKAATAAMPECGTSADPDPSYAAFRAAMLEAMRARNGGSLTVSNPRMRRSVHRSSEAGAGEDADYLERRARNNAAAKRSRDLRKQKEDELAIRAAYLDRINAELRAQVAKARVCINCQATC